MAFPSEIRGDIATICDSGGILSAGLCQHICDQLAISIESLMIQLLPLASSYSKSPISSVQIGAVVRGAENDKGMAALYLGANLEFPGQPLCYSLHAEQAAVSNAWSYNESSVTAIATSAPPCGHCRQFLYEISGYNSLPVLFPSTNFEVMETHLTEDFESIELSLLLPAAFTPADLGCEKLLMESSLNNLKLVNSTDDDLLNRALDAANSSYAPYTKHFSGCALKLTNGKIFTGRYAENVAFNPSLLPFPAALSKMILNNQAKIIMSGQDFEIENIKRVLLVETQSKINHRDVTENLLRGVSKELRLEYVSAISDSSV